MTVPARHLLCVLAIALAAIPASAAAAPSDLDRTFSGDGQVVRDLAGADTVGDVLALPNGRTLVAVGSGGRVGLLRYLQNGAPDRTFSGDGLVLTTIPRAGGPWIPGGAAVAPNGRIFLSAENQEGDVVAVIRYLANGSLDTGFNSDGIAFATTFREEQHCGSRPDVAVGADLRPLVAFGGGNAFCSWYAALLRTNGTLQRGLYEDGGDFSFAHETAVLPDGRMLVMGTAGDGSYARAFRYLPDGTPDLTFGFEGGAAWGTDFGDIGRRFAIDRQGRILTGGYGFTGETVESVMTRVNSDGATDEAFGPGGVTPLDFGGGDPYQGAWYVAVAPDGDIIGLQRFEWRLAALADDGSQDASFDPAATHVPGAVPAAVAVQPDGRILAAGTLGDDVLVIRYAGDRTTCLGEPVTRYGSGTIGGTPGPDVLLGSDGPDTVSGAGGDDRICALGANDVLRGGTGADRFESGSGKDFVYGDAGTDLLSGGPDPDRLDGGTENDRLYGEGGNDNLFGGSGTDDCSGGDGTDTGNGCERVDDIP